MAVIKSKKQRQSGKRKTLKRKSNKSQRGGHFKYPSSQPKQVYGSSSGPSRRSARNRRPPGVPTSFNYKQNSDSSKVPNYSRTSIRVGPPRSRY